MSLPRGRVFTLSPYQPRPVLPVAVHRGDILDVTVNWVRLLRINETPNELLTGAKVAGRGLSISNVTFEGKYLHFTVSGVQASGIAGINMAVATNHGRTLSRSLVVRTVWEEEIIEPVLTPDPVCQLYELVLRFWGLEDGGFFHQDGGSARRKAYGTGAYESTFVRLEPMTIYDAEIVYIGAEMNSGIGDENALFVVVLSGDHPQDYFERLQIPDEMLDVNVLTADAAHYGPDGDGNTVWYWKIYTSSGYPWVDYGTFELRIDCPEVEEEPVPE